jgi:WD40 repeat protein
MHFPVVATAWQAAMKEEFLLHGVTSSTGGCAVLVIINGPIRLEIGSSSTSSPDGAQVVTAATDSMVRLWNVASGAELARLPHLTEAWSAAYSRDGTKIITREYFTCAKVWDTSSGVELISIEHNGAENSIWSAALSAHGSRVVRRLTQLAR